jgi:hypothetical protein
MSFSRKVLVVGLGALALGAAAIGTACSSQESTAPQAMSHPAPPAGMPMPQLASFEVAAGLPPVPGNINNGAASPQMVRNAYKFAAEHPEVLKYVPCFCGCERMGHEGNDDCFVGKRDASGKPTEWETHGLVCEICIDVANDAMRMYNSGASVSAIRTAIDERYSAGRPKTPTPMPPKSGKSSH